MKQFLLLCLLVFSNFAWSQIPNTYQKIKINTGEKGLLQLAQQGIAIDHGSIKKGVYFITELSLSEIEKVKALGLAYEVLIPDMTAFYQSRNRTAAKEYTTEGCLNCPDYPVPENFSYGSMAGFYTFDEMLAILDSMKAKFPNLITTKQAIGSYVTNDGNEIFYVKISDNPDLDEASTEPQTLYTAVHHAREVQSLTQLIYYMWYLLENYDTNPEIAQLVNNRELYFIPCVNPDGYIYNQTSNPDGGGMWRKNRRNNGSSYGVDLNRNYGAFWAYDNTGSSPSPSSETYRGPAAFSEIETQAVRDFCNSHQFQIALNAHTYSNLLIYPYGYIASTETPDANTFRCIADEMVACSGFLAGTGDETVGYVSNGDSDDWMYEEQTTKNKIFSLTPEAGSDEDGFWPEMDRIIPIANNTLQQNLYAARLSGYYADIQMQHSSFLGSLSSFIHFDFKRTGVMDGGTYSVSLVPLSSNIESVGAPKNFSTPEIGIVYPDSIALNLFPSTAWNEPVTYAIKWTHSSGYTITDTFHAIYSVIDTIFHHDCNSTSGWTGTWGLSTSSFVSPGGSLTESPTGSTPSLSTLSITTSDWIDLSEVSAAELKFNAKWDIEKAYDYVEVQAIVEGGGTSTLCGKYTRKGNDNQDGVSAMYDGLQNDWVAESISLNAFAGEKIKLKFTVHTDPYVTGDGFYLDDVLVLANIAGPNHIPTTQSENWDLQAYPNPAHQSLHLKYHLPQNLSNATFILTDITGKAILQQDLKAQETQANISLEEIPAGIYIYYIQTAKHQSKKQKLSVLK